jgi:hypothetical protein
MNERAMVSCWIAVLLHEMPRMDAKLDAMPGNDVIDRSVGREHSSGAGSTGAGLCRARAILLS